MKEIIKKIIEQVEQEENYTLLQYIKELIERFAETINCPSNWRSIGEELAEEYKDNSWIFDELELWNYEE